MDHYGMPPGFWKEFIIIIGVIIFILVVIPAFLRRRMGADKKKWFSYNHINDFHEKWDWILRICFIFILLFSSIFFMGRPHIVFLISSFFIAIQQCLHAFVEWKYTENRNNYKVSLIEIGLLVYVSIGVFLFLN